MATHAPSRFWNQAYGTMCFVNFLISFVVFVRFPIVRDEAMQMGYSAFGSSVATGFFAIGMFLPGPFSAYLVDAFSRKKICMNALLLLGICGIALLWTTSLTGIAALRIVEGAAYGLFQTALGSTIINDLSVSSYRTRTDYYYMWFSRLSFPLCAVAALWAPTRMSATSIAYVLLAITLLCLLLVMSVTVPFRAPNRTPILSLDRFLLPRAWVLMLNLFPIAIIPGLLLGGNFPTTFMFLYGAGLLIAFLTHRTFFENADARADAVSGMLLLVSSALLLLLQKDLTAFYLAFTLCGIGQGWFASRLLLYFLKLSGHCQRGTLQQTYVLTATFGISTGFALSALTVKTSFLCLAFTVAALFLYLLVTHRWFVRMADRDFKFREV